MDLRKSLAVCLLLAPLAAAAQEKDLNAEFEDAVDAFNDEGPKAALPKLDSLIADRWDELSPMGKHGVATLAMYCELRAGSHDKCLDRGAWLHGRLPEAFSSLADFSASDVPEPRVRELRGSIQLLSLKTGRGNSVIYVHNASDRPIRLTNMTYEVAFGYETGSSSVEGIWAKGPFALGKAVLLPAGGGQILASPEGAAAEPEAADLVTIVACATRDRLPGWIHLTQDGYTQSPKRVHLAADVRWGDEELGQVPLALYDDPVHPVAGGASPTRDLNTEYRGAFDTLVEEGPEAALPKFESLVDSRWNELSPMGKHGALTATMFCELGAGRVDSACAHGAWFHAELPEAFSSLADFSASDVPSPEVAELRASIQVLAILTAKGESLVYVHNASNRPIAITDTAFDVSYGYETASQSVGNLESSAKLAFENALHLPAGGGRILHSTTGSGLLSTALPDCVAIIACAAKERLPGWHHLTKGDYTQTLRKVHITASVEWGDAALGRVPLAWYDRPAEADEEATAEQD